MAIFFNKRKKWDELQRIRKSVKSFILNNKNDMLTAKVVEGLYAMELLKRNRYPELPTDLKHTR